MTIEECKRGIIVETPEGICVIQGVDDERGLVKVIVRGRSVWFLCRALRPFEPAPVASPEWMGE